MAADGHLGMMALSRVTLASAGLSCWFRPPNAQNLLPKICTKSPVSRLVWQIDWAYRGFSGMADSMEPCKMLWADPCCHSNEIWAGRGDPVTYQHIIIIIYYD